MSNVASSHARKSEPSSAKETAISLLIAFTIALIFRGIVLEPFQIPTGSMAPTLLGAHVRLRDTDTGYQWATAPSEYVDRGLQMPRPTQNVQTAVAPMTQRRLEPFRTRTSGGDRIFVLKYLYPYGEPERFDVVVFRNPTSPQEYYIKRLIGLSNEEIAIVDGDVFTRPRVEGRVEEPGASWAASDWRIARKPDRVQNAAWQELFDSRYTPLNPVRDGRRWFVSPWKGSGWEIEGRSVYRFGGTGATTLEWDQERRPITDLTHYNDAPQFNFRPGVPMARYPVADVRLRAGVKPGKDGGMAGATITVNGHEFNARVEGNAAEVRMRPIGGEGSWTVLARAEGVTPLAAGRVTEVEVAHADQAVSLRLDGALVVRGEYEWTPQQRLEFATGQPASAMLSTAVMPYPVSRPELYTRPGARFEFDAGEVELHRVSLARDFFYQPAWNTTPPRLNTPARGSHPDSPVITRDGEYFMAGDNSGASLDGRLWGENDRWVSALIDENEGVVSRDLVVGKAFCVFFPALVWQWGIVPIPDLGHVRWIW